MTNGGIQHHDKQTRLGSRQTVRTVLLVVVAITIIVLGVQLVTRWQAARSIQDGLELNKQGAYDAAINAFTQAIQVRPGEADAYLYRGTVLLEAGRAEEAVTDFTQVLELRPDNMVVYLYRGDSYLAMGLKAQATADYQYALDTAGDDQQLVTAARTKLYLMEGSTP